MVVFRLSDSLSRPRLFVKAERPSPKSLHIYTASWGCWKYPFGILGVRLMFWKQNCTRNPNMGSKQSIKGATQYYFFQKTVFGSKKSSKNWTFCWFLNFLCQYKYMSNTSSEKSNSNLKYYQNVKNSSIVSHVTFHFWKSCVWGPEMVFFYQNCSYLLREKIVLVIEKNVWNSRLKAENLQNFWDRMNNLFKQWKVRTIFGNLDTMTLAITCAVRKLMAFSAYPVARRCLLRHP